MLAQLLFIHLATVHVDEVLFSDRFEKRGFINDTGVTRCATLVSNAVDCPVHELPDQDAQHGRDNLAVLGLLHKRGSGLAGFDFTKLDGDGQSLPPEATDWSCVLDNYTGLIWQVRSNDPNSPHFKNNTYTWFSPDGASNGGNSGQQDGGFCTEGPCDTSSYIALANEDVICGASDWRLPSELELTSIANRSLNSPAIDPNFFPDTLSGHYWAKESYSQLPSRAWTVVFNNGRRIAVDKTNAYRVRLVYDRFGGSDFPRGAKDLDANESFGSQTTHCQNTNIPATHPTSDFEITGQGEIVRHKPSGLEWMRCSLGQEWTDNTCLGTATALTWEQAFQAAQGMAAEGWRVPSINELVTLVEKCRNNPTINTEIFPNTVSGLYWSSTPYSESGMFAWALTFFSGNDSFWPKAGNDRRLRLVRDNLGEHAISEDGT